jgi:anaerobic selenocysteine-containing dehydrogenase
MQPYHLLMLADNNVESKPFMIKALEDTVLKKDMLVAEINPKTASKLGLKDGDKIMIRSAVSSAPAMVNLFEATRPGMISVPLGLGHTVANKFVRGKGINARELMDIKEDPVSGMPLCWNTRVQIFKI